MNTQQGGGYYAVHWQPRLASGIYFCRLHAESLVDPSKSIDQVKKMIMLK